MTRGGAAVACRAHNPKVAGSSPAPATNTTKTEGNKFQICINVDSLKSRILNWSFIHDLNVYTLIVL